MESFGFKFLLKQPVPNCSCCYYCEINNDNDANHDDGNNDNAHNNNCDEVNQKDDLLFGKKCSLISFTLGIYLINFMIIEIFHAPPTEIISE